MRPYEVVIIYDPALEEDAIRAAVDRATELIRSRGGTPGRVDRWGRRRLAYEIRHQREGYYVLLEATAEPAAMTELDRSLFLADEVLRHKVIRLPDRVAGRARRPASRPGEPGAPAALAADEVASSPSRNGA
ncbi:MAG: 30S ribosomal protein S6 [Actinomycetota bacterium]|nr:30S ribosomal protein S6 [Actinomycetota bacterium]